MCQRRKQADQRLHSNAIKCIKKIDNDNQDDAILLTHYSDNSYITCITSLLVSK